MATHNITGRQGENLAVQYFTQKGYDILHCNWRHGHWEVDIIASHNKILHFIEVKTRRTATFGHPEENIDAKKIKYLINASEEFLYQYPQWTRIQFDVLAITLLKDKEPDFFLIEDVYE
ncbi:MAG: YraN family protein [Bacteroidetes bacterium]|nr:YraN family protein [Bacteroidota bacterium]MBS1758340.1 YraN family protein [Bacteroidota bacterium]